MLVKIGTISLRDYQQVKRAPKGAWYSVVRGAPEPGDVFALLEDGKIAVLQCDSVTRGPRDIYFAKRV
jgi:hypothetical protein